MTFIRQQLSINKEIYVAFRTEKGYAYLGKENAHHDFVRFFPDAMISPSAAIDEQINQQLQQYFDGEPIDFDVPLDYIGRPFNKLSGKH